MAPRLRSGMRGRVSILAEAVLDQPDELEQRRVGAVAARMDRDRIALRGAEHHQSHDRGAVDARSALFDLDRHAFRQAADEGHDFGAGARVQAALVDRKSTRLNYSHYCAHRMPPSA